MLARLIIASIKLAFDLVFLFCVHRDDSGNIGKGEYTSHGEKTEKKERERWR